MYLEKSGFWSCLGDRSNYSFLSRSAPLTKRADFRENIPPPVDPSPTPRDTRFGHPQRGQGAGKRRTPKQTQTQTPQQLKGGKILGRTLSGGSGETRGSRPHQGRGWGNKGKSSAPQSGITGERKAKKIHFPEGERPRNRPVGVTKVSFPGKEGTSISGDTELQV